MDKQLNIFAKSFSEHLNQGIEIAPPNKWLDAFKLLTKKFDQLPKNKKIVIFFDELPWLATPRSDLLNTIDHYWNTNWQYRKNLIFVICGSAASWMLKKIIHNKGGLHNRLTRTLLLEPFNLKQTKSFLAKISSGGNLNDRFAV